MSFRLVSSGGATVDPTVVSLFASGVVKNGNLVDFQRVSGVPITPSTSSSTTTMVFGVCLDYAQGASDAAVKVIPINQAQLWEADCANAATTVQIGFRHALGGIDRSVIHNLNSDTTGATGIFLALALVGSTSGSGKLIGRILSNTAQLIPVNSTTFLQ